MYNRNIKEAIKHMELLQEQLASLEQRNDMLTKQLNTAICLLCSNKARVVKGWCDATGSMEEDLYALHVLALDGTEDGAFSPELTPYQAVLTGIDEYIEYVEEI